MRGQAGENHRGDKPDQRQRHPAREKRGDRQERLHAGELAARSEQGDQDKRGKEPSGPVMPWEPRAQKSQQSTYACESTNPQNIKKGMHKTVRKSCLNIGLRQFILNAADRTSRAITWRGNPRDGRKQRFTGMLSDAATPENDGNDNCKTKRNQREISRSPLLRKGVAHQSKCPAES